MQQSMVSILVDPVLVTIPAADASMEDVEHWLTNLDSWLKEALSSPYSWVHCLSATKQLITGGRFPNFDVLRAWQKKFKLDISIGQISRRVNAFFNNKEFDLEDTLEKLGYLIELDNISIIIRPELFFARWNDLIRDDLRLLLAVACACKYMNEQTVRGLSIATLALADSKEVEVSAVISYSVPEFTWDAGNTISQTFPLLFTPDDIPPLDIISLWRQGEAGIHQAIDQQYKSDWQDKVPHPMKYRIGPYFIESVNEAYLNSNEVLLRRIVRLAGAVIADQAKNVKCNLRPRRNGDAGDSPQLTRARDDANCWRLTIIPDGAGWRMDYWQVPTPEGSMIEFAGVFKKRDQDKIFW